MNNFETIFWKVIHNKYLFKAIFYWIEYRGLNKISNEINTQIIKFKNITSMKWMLQNKQYALLKCKLVANEEVDMDKKSFENLFYSQTKRLVGPVISGYNGPQFNGFFKFNIEETTFIELLETLLKYKKEHCKIIVPDLIKMALKYQVFKALEILTNQDNQHEIYTSTITEFLKTRPEKTQMVCSILLKSNSFSNIPDGSPLKELIKVNSSNVDTKQQLFETKKEEKPMEYEDHETSNRCVAKPVYDSCELVDQFYEDNPCYEGNIVYLYKQSYINAIKECNVQVIQYIECRIKEIKPNLEIEFYIPSEVFNGSFKSNGIDEIKELVNYWYETDYKLFKIGTFNNYINELSALFGESCCSDIEIQEQLDIRVDFKRFPFSKLLYYQLKNNLYKSTTLIFNKSTISESDYNEFIEELDNPIPQYLYDEDLDLCKIPTSKLPEIENAFKYWFGQLEIKQKENKDDEDDEEDDDDDDDESTDISASIFGEIIRYIYAGLIQVKDVTMDLVKHYYYKIQGYNIEIDHGLYHSFHYISIRSPEIMHGYILSRFLMADILKDDGDRDDDGDDDEEEDPFKYEGPVRYDCNKMEDNDLENYFIPDHFSMEYVFDTDFSELLDRTIEYLLLEDNSNNDSIISISGVRLFKFLLKINREDLFFHYLRACLQNAEVIESQGFSNYIIRYICNSMNSKSIDKFIKYIQRYGDPFQFKKLFEFAISNGTLNYQIIDKLRAVGISYFSGDNSKSNGMEYLFSKFNINYNELVEFGVLKPVDEPKKLWVGEDIKQQDHFNFERSFFDSNYLICDLLLKYYPNNFKITNHLITKTINEFNNIEIIKYYYKKGLINDNNDNNQLNHLKTILLNHTDFKYYMNWLKK